MADRLTRRKPPSTTLRPKLFVLGGPPCPKCRARAWTGYPWYVGNLNPEEFDWYCYACGQGITLKKDLKRDLLEAGTQLAPGQIAVRSNPEGQNWYWMDEVGSSYEIGPKKP